LGSTIIRRGVKLDNQIQIAHNVEVGKNTVIAAQTGIAGSTKIGENCQIGGQVGIVGHITIGNNVKIQAQSGIGRSIKDNEVVQGSPALGYSDYNKSYVHFKNLPKLAAKAAFIAKAIRDSSPPEAIAANGPTGTPGLVEISKPTLSIPFALPFCGS